MWLIITIWSFVFKLCQLLCSTDFVIMPKDNNEIWLRFILKSKWTFLTTTEAGVPLRPLYWAASLQVGTSTVLFKIETIGNNPLFTTVPSRKRTSVIIMLIPARQFIFHLMQEVWSQNGSPEARRQPVHCEVFWKREKRASHLIWYILMEIY